MSQAGRVRWSPASNFPVSPLTPPPPPPTTKTLPTTLRDAETNKGKYKRPPQRRMPAKRSEPYVGDNSIELRSTLALFVGLALCTVLVTGGFVYLLAVLRQRQRDGQVWLPSLVLKAVSAMAALIGDVGTGVQRLQQRCAQLSRDLHRLGNSSLVEAARARQLFDEHCAHNEPPLPPLTFRLELFDQHTAQIRVAVELLHSLTDLTIKLQQITIDDNENNTGTEAHNHSGADGLFANNVSITPALVRRLQVRVRERTPGLAGALVAFEKSLIDLAYLLDVAKLSAPLTRTIEKGSARVAQRFAGTLQAVQQFDALLDAALSELRQLAANRTTTRSGNDSEEDEQRRQHWPLAVLARRHALLRAPHRLAVVVPLRDREEHAALFLRHMRRLFALPGWRRRDVHVFFVEQVDRELFNRAKLLNVGCLEASRRGYDYYAFHDVDMLPLSDRIDYSYPDPDPVHLATCVEQFEWTMPYPEYFGGVTVANSLHMQHSNGYSNRYWGWGGEDDDFARRVLAAGFAVERKSPPCNYGAFRSLEEEHDTKQKDSLRWEKLRFFAAFHAIDGLSTLTYELVDVQRFEDYTYIRVVL